MELQVNYDTINRKRTRAVNVRLTQDELVRYNEMAAQIGQPLTVIVRALCEAQYTALQSKGDDSNG